MRVDICFAKEHEFVRTIDVTGLACNVIVFVNQMGDLTLSVKRDNTVLYAVTLTELHEASGLAPIVQLISLLADRTKEIADASRLP